MIEVFSVKVLLSRFPYFDQVFPVLRNHTQLLNYINIIDIQVKGAEEN